MGQYILKLENKKNSEVIMQNKWEHEINWSRITLLKEKKKEANNGIYIIFENKLTVLLTSKMKSGFLMKFTQKRRGRQLDFQACTI
jgi:hypothetical protein